MTGSLAYLALAVATQQPATSSPGEPKSGPYDITWTSEKWTADETPYLKVRKEVEAVTDGRKVSNKPTDLFEKARRAVLTAKGSKDPVIVYRGAYYAYLLGGLEFTPEAKALAKDKNDVSTIKQSAVPSPHSREYDRLRFLTEGYLTHEFLDLGERLYRFDSSDREVAAKLSWIHSLYRPASRKRAVEIADKLLKTGDPEKYPAIYYVYGSAHHGIYAEEPTKENSDKALWGYRKYLASGPDWRPRAIETKALLGFFEKYLAEHKTP